MKRFALLVSLLAPSVAFAGGFEFPDNNAEALGRGAAFTAKADDPSAVEYNIAGLARQRGTNSFLGANLVFHTYEFSRSGSYPVGATDTTGADIGGMAYPKISNTGAPFFAPFLAISTDFNKLDRWTFAFAIFGPSAYGTRRFDNPVGTLPGPGRYDITDENLLIFYPTLAAAYRVNKWFDIGIALHLVVGSLHFESTAIVDLGKNVCPSGEHPACDSYTKLDMTGVTATAALGLMFHPMKQLSIGVNLRGKIHLEATGTATAIPPASNAMLPIDTQPGSFTTDLPWVLRLGLRYAFLKDGFEQGDVEVDGTYEAWADAQGVGSQAKIPSLSIFQDINPAIIHHFQDTFSLRLGGAYNVKLSTGVLTFRLGFYFDSAATKYQDTRIDFDTMAKYAPTVGVGFKVRGVSINLGYAYIWSPDRDVTNGDIRVLNAAANAMPVRSNSSEPTPAFNNGHYHAETQVISIGGTVAWDEFLKHKRVLAYE
jgi:long-chain fatty acid transport protein